MRPTSPAPSRWAAKFTPRQREIYDIVLGAQNAVIAAVKPGMTIGKTTPNSLYKIAYDYINTHGKDRNGEPLGKYFTHGVSHHIGLEVHDAADNTAPLKEGMVISVEPGIYIPEEAIGVRIEDVVLVTKDGAKVMSARPAARPGGDRARHCEVAMRRTRRQNVTYAALLAGAFVVAVLLSWAFGKPMDNCRLRLDAAPLQPPPRGSRNRRSWPSTRRRSANTAALPTSGRH